MLLFPAVAGLPHMPEDHGSRAAEEPVNSLKEVESPVSRFTSHTTAQLPSLSSICANFHALRGTCHIALDQTPHKEFQSFLQTIVPAAT